jgi:hypothetical protein
MLKWARIFIVGTVVVAVGEAHARERAVVNFRSALTDWPGIQCFGPDAEAVSHADAVGWRINLPVGRKEWHSVGLDLPVKLHGDFEVVLGYELLAVGNPIPVSGAGLQMELFFDTPVPVRAVITRLRKPNPKPAKLYDSVNANGETFGAARIDVTADGKDKLDVINYRADQPHGRLRILRVGSEVQYWVADGGSPFHKARSMQFETSDIKAMRVFCFSGYRSQAFDVRFTELALEGEQVSILGKNPESDGSSPSDPEPSRGNRSHLFLLGALLAGGLLVVGGIILFVLVRKKRRLEQGSAAA